MQFSNRISPKHTVEKRKSNDRYVKALGNMIGRLKTSLRFVFFFFQYLLVQLNIKRIPQRNIIKYIYIQYHIQWEYRPNV